MGVETVPLCPTVRLGWSVALGCLLATKMAVAFPASDATQPSAVTTAPPPSDSDLSHQLQLQSGAFAQAGPGWTIVPSISAEEVFTDNVNQSATNRRWDLLTIVSPGVSIVGDTPNIQLRLNYQPQAKLAARTPSENNISNQLLGTATITVVPDLFYVDARALAGAGPSFGGFGSVGAGIAPPTGQFGVGSLGSAALSKQNRTQTTSFGVTPYLLHRFGDYGTGKIGVEYSQSSSANNGEFLPVFFTTGNSVERLTTTQEVAQFETGEFIAPFRNLIVAGATQGNGTGVARNSSQNSIVNRLGYDINRSVNVYGEVGWESLRFGGVPPTNIDDAVWGFGTTLTPNPDSQITIGYGHQNGTTGVQLNAYYALTARTRISAQYSTGLQSDLQQIQSQLDLADLDANGNAIDSQTGAPLFIGNNAIGFQSGLFRTKNFSASASTVLDRDFFSLAVQLTQSTTVATNSATINPSNPFTPPVGSTTSGYTGYFTWTHQFNEDLSWSTNLSYGTSKTSSSGNFQSIGAITSLQYALSESVNTFARYAYFDRLSDIPGQTIYQNLVIVGISKQF